jgi:P27 family predicted phage terminase small subunit
LASPHPHPTALKKIKGTLSKRAATKNEPQPSQQLPPIPPWLKPVAQDAWNALVPELQRLGIITLLDVNAFARYCCLLADWKECIDYIAANGPDLIVKDEQGLVVGVVPTPYPRRRLEYERELHKYEDRYGLTPSARTKLNANPEGERVDELDAMLDAPVVK